MFFAETATSQRLAQFGLFFCGDHNIAVYYRDEKVIEIEKIKTSASRLRNTTHLKISGPPCKTANILNHIGLSWALAYWFAVER